MDSINQKETEEIEQLLKEKYGLYESTESLRHRQEVLGILHKLFEEWVVRVGEKKGLTQEAALQKGFKLFTFGSYRLGVQSPDADIDTLIVVPRHIEREQHFFGDLYKILEANQNTTELTSVPKARVPVIKLVFSGVHIDLLFARTAKESLDPNLTDLSDDHILRNCDQASILSLNGRRVTDMILQLIPKQSEKVFPVVLKCVKLWAKQKGIYSNILGYPGGVALAILVAKACQLFPHFKANQLLVQFFEIFSNWKWPIPVSLTEQLIKHEDWTSFVLKVWGTQEGKADLMPILTPAFPSGNATYNVSKSTKDVIISELRQAVQDSKLIKSGTKSWSVLFEPYNFFREHRQFLRIDILANSKTSFLSWSGFVQSKLRMLILNLQTLPGLLIRPWPKSYNVPDPIYPESATYFFGLRFTLDDQRLEKIEKNSEGVYVLNLEKAVQDFGSMIKTLDGVPVEEASMNVKVAHIKRYQLPDQVFDGPRPKYAKLRPSANPPKTNLQPRPAPAVPAPPSVNAFNYEPQVYKKGYF